MCTAQASRLSAADLAAARSVAGSVQMGLVNAPAALLLLCALYRLSGRPAVTSALLLLYRLSERLCVSSKDSCYASGMSRLIHAVRLSSSWYFLGLNSLQGRTRGVCWMQVRVPSDTIPCRYCGVAVYIHIRYDYIFKQ